MVLLKTREETERGLAKLAPVTCLMMLACFSVTAYSAIRTAIVGHQLRKCPLSETERDFGVCTI